jgi:hypothetical protein
VESGLSRHTANQRQMRPGSPYSIPRIGNVELAMLANAGFVASGFNCYRQNERTMRR